MRSIRVKLVIILVFALLLTIYGYLNQTQQSGAQYPIFDIADGSINEIILRSQSSPAKLRFVKESEHWLMTEPAVYRVDESKLRSMEAVLESLIAVRRLTAKPKDLAEFGLIKSVRTIEFSLKDGTTQSLLIGADTVSTTQCYVRKPSMLTVFIVNKVDIERFQGVTSDYRDRQLLTVDPARIVELRITEGSRLFKLARNKSTGKWELISPIRAEVKGDAVKELLDRIRQVEITEFVGVYPDKMKNFGLDSPRHTLTVSDRDGKRQKFDFGDETKSGEGIYIRDQRQNEVYTVNTNRFRPELLKINQYLNEAPLSIGIGEVNRITIIDRGKTFLFNRDISKPGDTFTMAGQPLKMTDFNTLYINLMALVSEGYDPANLGGDPRLTVIFGLRKAKAVKAEFSQKDESTYDMTVNGKNLPFYVSGHQIEVVREWLTRVAEK